MSPECKDQRVRQQGYPVLAGYLGDKKECL
jgi:hypothetical protein